MTDRMIVQNCLSFLIMPDVIIVFQIAHHLNEGCVVDFIIASERKPEATSRTVFEEFLIRTHDNRCRILLTDLIELGCAVAEQSSRE